MRERSRQENTSSCSPRMKSSALQPQRAATAGTLPTDTFLFSTVVVGTAILVVALTYLPAVALGPIVEHLLMVGH